MRKHADLLFQIVSLSALVIALAALGALVYDIFVDGASRLSWSFITNIASRNAEDAGVYHALMGSIWVIALTGMIALPTGVAAAINDTVREKEHFILWLLYGAVFLMCTLMFRNPLVGPLQPGDVRFPDMSDPYDAGLRALLRRVATEQGIRVQEGVSYVGPIEPA